MLNLDSLVSHTMAHAVFILNLPSGTHAASAFLVEDSAGFLCKTLLGLNPIGSASPPVHTRACDCIMTTIPSSTLRCKFYYQLWDFLHTVVALELVAGKVQAAPQLGLHPKFVRCHMLAWAHDALVRHDNTRQRCLSHHTSGEVELLR